MNTMTQTTQQRKPPKQPQAVHGVARWIGGNATQGQLDNGDAVLQITAEGKATAFYFVGELKDEHGQRVGFRLVKIDGLTEPATYDVDATAPYWTCDCPDAIYCERPGGCKHVSGLRAALTAAGLL